MQPVQAQDPLGHGVPLSFQERFFPAGFPLVLQTNSESVVAAARYGFGEYMPLFEAEPIDLRVVVAGEDGDVPPDAADAPSFAGQGHVVAYVLGRENYAVCDLDRCFCFVRLTPAVARDPVYASFHFLDAAAYSCVTHRHTMPIHAACVARDGRGILLVGPSGAGKSSLAWACARAGLAYVCDDCTWLLRNGPEPSIVGKCHRVRFRPDVFSILPELRPLPKLETVKAKRSFEIRTTDVPGLATAPRCRPWKVLFLAREPDGPAELTPVTSAEARRRLEQARILWEPRAFAEQLAALDRLAGCEAFDLRYSSLSGAVDCIRNLA